MTSPFPRIGGFGEEGISSSDSAGGPVLKYFGSDCLGLSPSGIDFGLVTASAKAFPHQAEVKYNDLATGVVEHGL